MPLYDYRCNVCNEIWEEVQRMTNNKVPETLPCPKCGAENSVEQTVAFTTLPMSCTMEASNSIRKLNNASKFKEKLQQIHDNTPGSQLNKSSTIVDIK